MNGRSSVYVLNVLRRIVRCEVDDIPLRLQGSDRRSGAQSGAHAVRSERSVRSDQGFSVDFGFAFDFAEVHMPRSLVHMPSAQSVASAPIRASPWIAVSPSTSPRPYSSTPVACHPIRWVGSRSPL